jgi:UDP-2-acetamido-3-amino-2,3-dideoxy-glucuronate N-acetyltransferase
MNPSGNNSSIAVIGTGYWGKNLVRNFHSLGALHTVCDANPDTLQNFMQNYPGVLGVSSYSEILTNNDIKGIVISTPAEMHADMAKEALLAGKDVYNQPCIPCCAF